jgi:hypothetical protein
VTSNARILKLFSLSYIPSELTTPSPCRQVYTSGRNFEEHGLLYEQWKSVLHLSTRWGFASLRKLALRSIKPPTAFDQLLLARTYNVDPWVLPALSTLCKRKRTTSVKEARQMSIEDVVVIATVREEIRIRKPFIDTSEIERRIESAQDKVVAHVDDDDSEIEGEAEYVADTISKEGCGENATHPYPVSGQPAGAPIMSRPATPPSKLVAPGDPQNVGGQYTSMPLPRTAGQGAATPKYRWFDPTCISWG